MSQSLKLAPPIVIPIVEFLAIILVYNNLNPVLGSCVLLGVIPYIPLREYRIAEN